MSAGQIADLIAAVALLPTARWEELAADHVPFDDLSDIPDTEERLRREIRQDHSAVVVGGRGGGKTSVIASVTDGLKSEGFVPLRIGVIAAERDAILDPARFAKHVVQEVLAQQDAQVESWQRAGLVEATAEEVTIVTSGPQLSASATLGVKPVEASMTGKLRSGSRQLLRTFDTSTAVDALKRLVGIVNYGDGSDESRHQPVFVVEDTDAWLGDPFDTELVEAFFQRDLRMLVNEVPAPTVVSAHPEYLETAGFRAVQDRLGRVEIPVFDDAMQPLSRILQHRIDRAKVAAPVQSIFDAGALGQLAELYADSGANLRAVLLVAHYALEERPGAAVVTADDVQYARRAHLP
jgi:hypothetical protein